MSTAYPAPPWRLAATLLLGVFVVPAARLPESFVDAVPDGVRPARPAGRALLGAAFVRYGPGGVMSYDELLVAGLGFGAGWAPRCTVGRIWVDDEASRTGGRELWAIPKQLGVFDWQDRSDGVVRCELEGVARLAARAGRALAPWPVGASLVTAQHRGDRRPVVTWSRVTTRPRALRSAWWFDPDGPLGFLAGRRPVLGVVLEGASLAFGTYSYG
jgi:hypothetical protein